MREVVYDRTGKEWLECEVMGCQEPRVYSDAAASELCDAHTDEVYDEIQADLYIKMRSEQ